jgi:hypothetical protein
MSWESEVLLVLDYLLHAQAAMLLIMYYMLEAIPSVLHVGGSYATSISLVAWQVSVNIQSTFVTTQAVNSQLSCMGLL